MQFIVRSVQKMDSDKIPTTTEVKWYSCTRCGRVYHDGGMRYVGHGQWMCDLCYEDMFGRKEDEE